MVRFILRRCIPLFAAAFTGSTCSVGLLHAADGTGPDHAIVPGFERFFGGETAPPAADAAQRGGQLLMGELNCASCHAPTAAAAAHLQEKQAPILNEIGQRARPEYLRQFIANPHATKAGATMPNVIASLPAAEREQTVEALVHFLAATGIVAEQAAQANYAKNGEKLFHSVGCVACHQPRGEGLALLPTSVPLGDLSAKYTIPGLISFLQDPLKVRPSARMPHPNLKNEELRDIAHYLLQDVEFTAKPLDPKLNYSYYEGAWSKLPNFDDLKPVASGQSDGFDVKVARREGNMGLRFTGFVHVAKQGNYTFLLHSDDGSKLYVDGKLVVDNDGTHPPMAKTGIVALAPGPHELKVDMFNAGGGTELDVKYTGPDLSMRPLTTAVSPDKNPKSPKTPPQPAPGEEPPFQLDPQLASKGGELFGKVGCANCHRMDENKQPIKSELLSLPLAQLNPARGCLAEGADNGTPRYALTGGQRKSLAAAVAWLNTAPAAPTAKEQMTLTLTAMNCYACHERDGIGGPEPARNELFTTNQKEMGDEARIPPLLTGVGAKLTADWMNRVFDNGQSDRPYMFTRMPKFGKQNIGHLVAAFESLDSVPEVPVATYEETPRRVKESGRYMVGGQAFGCVKCHNFRGIQATGIQAIDMSVMTQRLKRDWFHHYMMDPPAFRPGTRMPTAWPKGKSVLQTLYHGDANMQLDAVWNFLADGTNAAIPYGLGRDPIELYAVDEAVMYRNFIQDAGPRAIGVAYPESANLAWDANNMRLALIWQGAFIDAAKHWVGRGPGFQQPLGGNVIRFADTAPLAVLDSSEAAWPTRPAKELGYKFRGYHLDKARRPTFLYDYAGARVEDKPVGIAGEKYPGLGRTLNFTAEEPVENLWFRARVAPKITELEDGWYSINGDWKLRIESDDKPVIRPVGNQVELLVPVKFTKGKATIAETFRW